MRKSIYLLSLLIVMASCSITKKIPQGQRLYNGAEINILNDSLVLDKKALVADLSLGVVPRENKKIFGFPYQVWFYYNIGEPKKKVGVRNFLRNKLAKEPIFFSNTQLAYNEKRIANSLENKGYFRSTVQSTSEINKKNEKAIYNIELSPRYYLDSIIYDSTVRENPKINISQNSLIKKGQPYELTQISAERERISELFRSNGYYFINPSLFEMLVDTNKGSNKFDLSIRVKPKTNIVALKQYYLRDIKIVANSTTGIDGTTVNLDQLMDSRKKMLLNEQTYKPKVFLESILLRPGDLYSTEKRDASLDRLTNLKNFKFIRNKFDLMAQGDTNVLDAYFYLTPVQKKSIKLQLSGLTKSNGLYGSEAALSWQNRNIFGGAEILNFELTGGIDLQFGQIDYGNNYRRLGIKGELNFPRFLIPYNPISQRLGNGVPKTNISLSYELLNRRDFYTQNSSNASLSYLWKKNIEFQHDFSPLYLTLIRSSNFSDNFIEQIFLSENLTDIERYFQILESRLILGAEYKLNYTPKNLQTNGNRTAFTFGFDIAGNFASLIADKNEGGYQSLFKIPFEQFAKLDVEGRYYKTIRSFTWANRVIAGFGLPYDNSIILPFTKQFFVGGSNGLRGFRARSLGPGSVTPAQVSETLFGANAQGDIKLELNTEARFKVSSYVELAGFVDAGNIWTYRDDTFYGAQAQFTKDFMKQMAVDMGIGLRFDLTYLVIRGDLASPIRKPWLTDSPWVLNEFALGNKTWRQENLIFNLAIAHPF
ncbi:Outer membrane protein assembly factor BamA [Spirosomataceae bacterium TFI 002]|nr:Outer membrane protein assembly factor BamA [Spirosomataceae bacterium TFI 002]